MGGAESPAVPRDLVFVDLETTGGNAAHHRITEVGIVRMTDGTVVDEWSSLVNPECRIPAYIERFTGISNDMVANAPRFADIGALVLEKLGVAQPGAGVAPVFVAHNARFDYSFLRMEFRRLDRQFSAKVLCTVKLSRRLFPEFPRHSLDAIMQRHQLQCSARHRALGDARVPGELLAAAAGAVFGAQLQQIEWQRAQKKKDDSFTLQPQPNTHGVRLTAVNNVPPAELAGCFGVFHSAKDGRKALTDIARAHGLCSKILGVEDGGGCCQGACVGKEPPALHEVRLRLALSSLKLKSWPFPGRIALREGSSDYHILEHWVHLGTARSEEQLAEYRDHPAPGHFDADVYRIVLRHLAKNPHVHWHDLRAP